LAWNIILAIWRRHTSRAREIAEIETDDCIGIRPTTSVQ
jgi:hypothetical protein